jgi:hypothetical protein
MRLILVLILTLKGVSQPILEDDIYDLRERTVCAYLEEIDAWQFARSKKKI